MSEGALTVVVPPCLRLFLHRDRDCDTVRVVVSGEPSLGHVVSSLGVPLTEVEELRLDGAPTGPSRRAPTVGRLDVVPRRRPQPVPTTPPRFVLDVHLGTLARRLRLLGLDVAYRNDATDDDLVAQSARERRVLLTRDRGLLRRRAVRWGGYVRGQRRDDQLADVLDRFRPPLRPWTRCPACNGLLQAAPLAHVADRLQPGTLRSYDDFARCAACGRVYWRGAHARGLGAVIAAAERVADAAGPAGSPPEVEW